MTRYTQLSHGSLYAVDPASSPPGNIIAPKWDSTNKWSILIPGAGTFFFPLGGERYGSVVETIHHSLSLVFNAALAGTFTIEGTNCAKSQSGNDVGSPDVSDWEVSDAWQQIDITAAGMIIANITGSGNSMAKFTATIGGTAAGGALYNIPDIGMLRLRGKFVATHSGQLRVAAQSKLGS